jgi:membrane protein required for colicin V production
VNIFDLVILIILAFFVFNGFRRGFLREIAGLVGVVIAFILAVRFMNDFSGIISYYLGLSPRIAVIVTAVVIFVLVLVTFVVLAKIIQKLMEMATLGWVNRLFGSLFGLLKGVIIVSILALIISLVPGGQEFDKEQEESALFNPMRKAAPLIFNGVMKIVPAANDFLAEIKQSLSDRSGAISGDALDWLNSFRKKKSESNSNSEGEQVI